MKTNKINEKRYEKGLSLIVSFCNNLTQRESRGALVGRPWVVRGSSVGRATFQHRASSMLKECRSSVDRVSIEPRCNSAKNANVQMCKIALLQFCKIGKANFAQLTTNYFARVAAMLLMLVTMSVGQVWGAEMFSLNFTYTGSDVSLNNNYNSEPNHTLNIDATYATISGGTVLVNNNKTSGSGSQKVIGSDNSEKHLRIADDNVFIQVTLNNALAVGDEIVFNSNQNVPIALCDQPTRNTGLTIYPSSSTSSESKKYVVISTDKLVGKSTIYLFRGTGSTACVKTLSITRESSSCETYSFRYRDFSSVWHTLACFSTQKSGTDYITDEVELPVGDHFYVGWGDDFSSTHSLDNEIQYMYAGVPGQSNNYQFGNAWSVGNIAGAKGYFHIYTDSGEKNKAIRFVPSGYTLQFGSGETWSNDKTLVFAPASSDIYETTWETELTQLTSTMIGKQIWVGYQTSDGYVWCPKSLKVNLRGLRISNTETVGDSYADTYGKFLMYANSSDMNFYCTFVPYYVVELYDRDVKFGDTQSSLKSSPAKIVFTAPSARTGYTFGGWTRAEGDPYTVTSTMPDWTDYSMWKSYERFNAVWTANNYTITLNNQSATTAGTTSVTATYDANTNLTSAITKPAKTGYTFGGYYTAQNGEGSQVIGADGNFKASVSGYTDASKNWIKAENVTLYAKWTANQYTVTLNTNGGTINAGNVTNYTYGVGATLPTNVTKVGFTFDGWYANSGLTGDAVTTIANDATGNKEYWAKWTEAAPETGAATITYNLDVTNNGTTLQTLNTTNSTSNLLAVAASTALLNGGLGTGGSNDGDKNKHNGARTLGINTLSAKNADKYFKLTFSVTDGYQFIPSAISLKMLTIGGNATTYEMELVDASGHTVTGSVNATNDSEVTMANFSGLNAIALKGTVTLKLYAYYTTSGKYNAYRLTTPITITGTVEEAVDPVCENPANPVISCSNNSVTISCTTDGATIYYTTDGSTPTSSSTAYTAAVAITETKTFKAIAIKDACESEVTSQECTYVAPTPGECEEIFHAALTSATAATYTGSEADNANCQINLGDADSGKSGYKFKGNGKYVKIALLNNFQAGDKISFEISAAAEQGAMTISTASDGTGVVVAASNATISELTLPTGSYGKILYVARTSSQTYNAHITAISVCRPTACDKEEATLTWTTDPADGTVGDADITLAVNKGSSTGAVTYTSSNTAVATIVDGNKLHYVAAGTATITANLAGDVNYCPKSIEKSITVTAAPAPTTCFSMVVKNQSTAKINIDLSVGKDLESLSGGSVSQNDLDGNTKDMGLRFGNNADYICITLSSGTLVQGSKIIVSYNNGTADQGVGFGPTTSYTDWAAGTNCLQSSSTGAHDDQEFTVPAGSPLIGKSTFYVFRAGGNSVYLSKLSVTGCGAATYTVTYEGNGATGGAVPVDATAYGSGNEATVRDNTGSLVRTGYTFSGWNTKANGTGTDYAAGAHISMSADVTLYAKWSAKTTTVTIDANTANHGSTAPAAFTATVGQALPAFDAATGQANYSLKGYYTAAVGGNLVINADGTLVASLAGYTDANKKWAHDDAAVTLYAQYEKVNTACASVVINYSKTGDKTEMSAGEQEFEDGEVTTTACSAKMGHIDSSTERALYIEKDAGFKLGTGKIYLKVTFDTPLADGDRIEITATNAAHEFYLTANNTTYPTSGNKITSGQSYTVEEGDGLIDSQELYIWRGSGTTMYLRTIDRICSTGCKKPDLSFEDATVSKQVGAAAFTNTLTNTNGVDVVYSSTNEAVATVASNGQVTIVGGGTTTIKATAAEQTKGGTTYCEREVSYILNVCATTAITTQPAGETVGRGDNHTLSVVATGTNLSYQWYSCATENGTYAEIKGATNASYTFAALGERWYYCQITNGCGNVTESSKAHITLSTGAPTFTWTIAETVYKGQKVPFTIQTNSDATPNVSLVTANDNSLRNVTVNGNTITGTLVVNTVNYTGITLRVTTAETGNFTAGSDDKEIEISETCPSAGTEVVYSYTLTSDNINKTDVACTGGTATTNGIKTDDIKTYDSKDFFKTAGSIGATKNYIRANLSTALKVGDVITLVCANSSSSTKATFSIYAGTSTSSPKHAFVITTNKASQSVQYTVQAGDGLEDETQFQLGRDDSNAFIYSISVTSSGKVGSLQWEDSELSDGDVVVKKTGDANFTNVAIATSAGAISYSSDNTLVADVHSSTGEVTIGTTGRATITASLPEYGCYSAQTITYIVEVQSDCTAPTIKAQPVDADYEVNAAAAPLSVTATGATPLTYQWYSNTTKSNENGTAIPEATSATYTPTTTTKGTYYYYCVVTSETYCSTASGVATITVTKTCGEREAPSIIVAGQTGTELCWSSITLKAVKQDGTSEFNEGTYKWYKDGEEIGGQTEKTLVVNEAGTYYVEHVVDGCPMESSNRAYVEHKDAMAQRLTPFQYYHEYKVDDRGNHVDWTYSDQMKDRHLFAVRGLSEVGGEKYVVSASLKQDAADASPTDVTSSVAPKLDVVHSMTDTSVDTIMVNLNKLNSLGLVAGNELVISVAPYNCHGTAEDAQSITIYVIDEKPALAFIVAGADGEGTKTKRNLVIGGDFLTGYNKADLKTQTSTTEVSEVELPLYTTLKANFHVTPVNGYAPFNKLNYEPFDLVFLTDFVKTDGSGDKDAAKKKVNDLGQLVDYRPLFSTKCHMSGIDNWKKVGFTANPIVPKQTQLHMNIVCYAHPMFEGMATDGTNIFQDYEEQNETVFKMISGGGYDNGKGVQGFELSAAENFVIVAQTHHDAHGEVIPENPHMLQPVVGDEDKILVASCERQTNVEARMILLSLNADATSKLTEAGIDVIVRSLNYLMEIRQIKVTDCHFEFDNAAGDHLWSTPGNWAPRHSVLPTKNVNVRIAKNCTVDSKDAVAGGMKIMDGVTVTINANAALQLTGMARHLEDGELSPTSAGELIVLADADGSGAFIHGDEAGQTGATVQMYSSANATANDAGTGATVESWQWMTTPYNDVADAQYNYYGAWMYRYDNSSHQWSPQITNGNGMAPFTGYCITQVGNTTYTMNGTLASTANQNIPLVSGLNLVGNSWTAPINISAFQDEDFENAEATVVLFNTGLDEAGTGHTTEVTDASSEDVTTPGTYISIPVKTADAISDKLSVIPAMQAFEVRTNKGENGTLHLDYDRIVRKSGNVNIQPMRAPGRVAVKTSEDGIYSTLRIYVQGSHYGDFLYIFRNDETTMDYDNGWDGRKYMSNNLDIPVLMVRYGTNNWQISTQPEFVGTELAFYQGEDNVYTMGFQYDGEETLWLYDSTEDTYTEINNATTYTFTSNTTKLQKRFVIVGYNPNAPQNPGVATGVGDVSPDSGPRKLILNDKLFILNNGRLYDATGRLAY